MRGLLLDRDGARRRRLGRRIERSGSMEPLVRGKDPRRERRLEVDRLEDARHLRDISRDEIVAFAVREQDRDALLDGLDIGDDVTRSPHPVSAAITL